MSIYEFYKWRNYKDPLNFNFLKFFVNFSLKPTGFQCPLSSCCFRVGSQPCRAQVTNPHAIHCLLPAPASFRKSFRNVLCWLCPWQQLEAGTQTAGSSQQRSQFPQVTFAKLEQRPLYCVQSSGFLSESRTLSNHFSFKG